MKKLQKIFVVGLCFAMIFTCPCFSAGVIDTTDGIKKTGFEQQADGTWKYYVKKDNDYIYDDWKKVDGKTYYFDENGIMLTGIHEVDGKYCKFDSNGAYVGEASEVEWAEYQGNLTGVEQYNPLGVTYKEIKEEYKSIIDEHNLQIEAKEEERQQKLEAEKNNKDEMVEAGGRFYVSALTTEKKEKVDKAIKNFVDKYITDDMSDFEKEMYIIQYIEATNKYDYDSYNKHMKGKILSSDDCYNAYGALVKKTSVCAGYADAFKRMCDAVGIQSSIMNGPTQTDGSGPHAWNTICLDGAWYFVDVTWDDNGSIINNNWINRTTKEFNNHYGYPEQEIYDDGTVGTEEKISKLEDICTATEYGKETVSKFINSHKEKLKEIK